MTEINRIVTLLDKMWVDYNKMNPQTREIHSLFTKEGEEVLNDHIALRTFNLPEVGVDHLAKSFLACGYIEKGEYQFEEKKLFAKHFEHEDKNLPTVFISELKIEEFSAEFQKIIKDLISQIPDGVLNDFNFSTFGRPWNISTDTFQKLKKESEYGAWLAAFGYCANHFTVFINSLKKWSEVSELNTYLKNNGFKLNESGGEVKGSPDVCLEQSSTIANLVDVDFSDGTLNIPGCYYEFAKRYPLATGELYQGFVAKSADKIFESTDKGQ